MKAKLSRTERTYIIDLKKMAEQLNMDGSFIRCSLNESAHELSLVTAVTANPDIGAAVDEEAVDNG